MSSPPYLLLRILSCISPLARPLLLSNKQFLSCRRRGGTEPTLWKCDPLQGSVWSRCKNCGFVAISAVRAQPAAGIGGVEVESCHVTSRLVIPCCVMSCRVMSCHVMSCHVTLCHVILCLVMSCHVMSCHVLSCLVLSCLVLSCHAMSRYAVSRHVMSRHVMLRRAMSCHVLSRLATLSHVVDTRG